jgi:pimeloyl-ACP methyl ester carboxylesterase
MASGLFVPGWGAPASLYRAGLPEGWEVLELPRFRETGGRLHWSLDYVKRAIGAQERPVAVAGHSMGGALAVLAAIDLPQLVERLILVSPAGLPLDKPLRSSALTFLDQLRRGSYPFAALRRMAINTALAPRSAFTLARAVHDLDLTPALEELGARGVPCTVIASGGDQLVTCRNCREVARLLAAEYREIDAANGHIWPITQPERLARELTLAVQGG